MGGKASTKQHEHSGNASARANEPPSASKSRHRTKTAKHPPRPRLPGRQCKWSEAGMQDEPPIRRPAMGCGRGMERTNDASKKENGARRRRHHRPANRHRLSPELHPRAPTPATTTHHKQRRKEDDTAVTRQRDDVSQDITTTPPGRGTTPASAVVGGPAQHWMPPVGTSSLADALPPFLLWRILCRCGCAFRWMLFYRLLLRGCDSTLCRSCSSGGYCSGVLFGGSPFMLLLLCPRLRPFVSLFVLFL